MPGTFETATATDFGHLSEDLSFVSRVLRSRLLELNEPFFAEHKLAAGEVAVLNLIALNPGITQKHLASAVVVRKSGLTKLVNELEKAGFIERRKEGDDMRQNALYLTDDGTRRLAGMRPEMARIKEQILSPLSPGERAMLFELLWRIIDGTYQNADDQ